MKTTLEDRVEGAILVKTHKTIRKGITDDIFGLMKERQKLLSY